MQAKESLEGYIGAHALPVLALFQVANARRAAIDLSTFPTVARIEAALLALPEFKAAAPAAQPDAEAL